MANKVILGGTDVVKHYESQGDVKDKTMKTNKQLREQKKGYRAWLRISHQPIFSPPQGQEERKKACSPGKRTKGTVLCSLFSQEIRFS